MFLIRTAFWLTVVAMAMPTSAPSGPIAGAWPDDTSQRPGPDARLPADFQANLRDPDSAPAL